MVSQKFSNILGVIDQQVMKVTNHTGLWDTKLAYYSPSVICWIYLYGLEHRL